MSTYPGGTFNPTGIFYTSFNPAELNQRSFADMILRLFPNGSAPLFAMTGRLPKAQAKVVQHGYFTKVMSFASMVQNGAAAAADTTLTVDSTSGVVPGMTFQVPATREVIRVETVPSATTVTVTRAFGRVAAGAIADNAIMFGIGNAHTQSSLRPVSRTIQTTFVPNFTQIVRNSWAISDTARASLAEAGFSNIQESRQDAMLFHATDIESILFWGQAQAPAGNPPIHSTQGIIDAVFQYAPSNVQTAAATTNYDQLVALVEPAFSVTSNMGNAKERIAFVDQQANRVLHQIGREAHDIEMEFMSTTFGLQFTSFRLYKGRIFIIEHPLFNGLQIPAGLMVIVDMPSLRLAYMDGRDVKKEEFGFPNSSNPNRNQDGGIDADGGSLTSEFATEFKNPNAYAVVNGLTQGVP